MGIREKKSKEEHLNDYQTACYLDFLLSETSTTPTEKTFNHVENCPSCKDNLLDMILQMKKLHNREIKKAFPHEIRSQTLKKFRGSRKAIIKQIAASFFLFAFLFIVYLTVIKTSTIHQSDDNMPVSIRQNLQVKKNKNSFPTTDFKVTDPADKKPKLTQRTQLPDQNPDFKINSNLELMINSQTRNETIKIISPENKATFQGDILFKWEPFNIKPVQLKILNNKNNILFDYSLYGESFLFTNKLSPGLYYWKLENKNDLLHVGKFFINTYITSRQE